MKKFLGLVTASVLAFSMVACGTNAAKDRSPPAAGRSG